MIVLELKETGVYSLACNRSCGFGDYTAKGKNERKKTVPEATAALTQTI